MARHIAFLTSGGDAPGMNAAIRAVVRTSIYHGARITGIASGFKGLLAGEFKSLDLGSVADIIHRGGTILRTARSPEFMTDTGQKKAVQRLRAYGIDGLIVIGGEGSLHGALALEEKGVATIGVPATIDNDVAATDYTIGFDTAVNTALEAINKIRDTATSHGRVFLIEVMGRHSGEIALASGLAGGAETILVPGEKIDLQAIIDKIYQGRRRGKLHNIIIVAEGAGSALELADTIKLKTGIETRVTILGHIQRGGTPTAFDRILASRMGAKAVEALVDGQRSKMTAIAGQEIKLVSLHEALNKPRELNREIYELAGVLSI